MGSSQKRSIVDVRSRIVDYETVLPYNGNWIEFQNLSVNGEKYPKGFTVKPSRANRYGPAAAALAWSAGQAHS